MKRRLVCDSGTPKLLTHFLSTDAHFLCVRPCVRADKAEAELQNFSPYYRGQYSAARFAQVEEDLEPRKEKITQLLQQKVPGLLNVVVWP